MQHIAAAPLFALRPELKKALGVVLYEGPSKLDGKPIVVIATALKQSKNSKTGNMVQTYIIRPDMSPLDAVKAGEDFSICGDCPARGESGGAGRYCYVNLGKGARVVWDAYRRGVYPKASAFEAAALFEGRMVRLGSYGDPAAAPYALWKVAVSRAKGWTGYSHQWRTIDAKWAELVMASADSVEDVTEAHAAGFRTFRVSPVGGEPLKGMEILCPASEEAGKKTQCEACRACMGTAGKAKVSIHIPAHGPLKSRKK